MSSKRDFAKLKRQPRAGGSPFARWNTGRWRTEYPEQFPVITTRKECVDNTEIRPIDGNGHVPAAEAELLRIVGEHPR